LNSLKNFNRSLLQTGRFLWFINELRQARKRVESPFSTTIRHPASTCSQALEIQAVLPAPNLSKMANVENRAGDDRVAGPCAQ
jgi:hypothetical protein